MPGAPPTADSTSAPARRAIEQARGDLDLGHKLGHRPHLGAGPRGGADALPGPRGPGPREREPRWRSLSADLLAPVLGAVCLFHRTPVQALPRELRRQYPWLWVGTVLSNLGSS